MKINFANIGKTIAGIGIALSTFGVVKACKCVSDGFIKRDEEVASDNVEEVTFEEVEPEDTDLED